MNKNIFVSLIITVLLLNGCEPELSGVVEVTHTSYRVKTLTSIHNYNYNPLDSLLTLTVEFVTFDQVASVYCTIFGPDRKTISNERIFLLDNGNVNNGDLSPGDGKYSNRVPFSENYLNGNYTIEYYVSTDNNSTNQIGQEVFLYNNGKTNIPPVLSSLTAPDTITLITPSVMEFFSIQVEDSNGLGDVRDVYLQSYRPDGTTSGATISLYDDGGLIISPSSGDQVAGDGIYSLTVQLPFTTTNGLWRFVFRAIDRGNKLSNEISHNILVQ
jgi:hypothetical protein